MIRTIKSIIRLMDPEEKRARAEPFSEIIADYRRYKETGRNVALCQGFWAGFVYRIGRYIYMRDLLPEKITRYIFQPLKKMIEIVCGIRIPFTAEIGPGLFFPHFGCIIIHEAAIIGRNCSIYQDVTIGARSGKEKVPVIGDNVNIGAGAKVLGDIKIGNNVDVGANAVVLHDVPGNCSVAGIPARIIKWKEPGEQRKFA